MSINDGVEMTMLLELICFSTYEKMQGFSDKCVLLFTQQFKMATNSGGEKRFLRKVTR